MGTPFLPTFPEVLLAHASQTDWPIVTKYTNRMQILTSWYFRSSRRPADSRASVPFFPDVHEQLVKVWSFSRTWTPLMTCARLRRSVRHWALWTSTSNAAEAELSKSPRTQITLITVSSLCCHLVSASAA